jgi:hypothetical protein
MELVTRPIPIETGESQTCSLLAGYQVAPVVTEQEKQTMQNVGNQPTRSDCLATLSPRAQRMLEFAKWLRAPDDYESIIEMLESVGIEPTEALIQLQLCYGSLDYHTRYYAGIGLDFDIKAGFVDDGESNGYLIEALNRKSAQLRFAVDRNGRIYTRLKHTDPLYWEPYAHSLAQLIEGDALLDEICEFWNEPVVTSFGYCEIAPIEFNHILQRVDPTFSQVEYASDDNISWWMNESLRIEYHKAWLGRPNPNKYRLSVYGYNLEIVRAFVRDLMNTDLVPRKELEFYSYDIHNKRSKRYTRLYYGYP